jgi:hypothetical protein
VFARFAPDDRAFVYSRSLFIIGGLEFGGELAIVTEQEMNWLRTLAASGATISEGEALHCGDRVRVQCGQLAGIEARLVDLDGESSLLVQFELLGRVLCAKVDRDQLRRTSWPN